MLCGCVEILSARPWTNGQVTLGHMDQIKNPFGHILSASCPLYIYICFFSLLFSGYAPSSMAVLALNTSGS